MPLLNRAFGNFSVAGVQTVLSRLIPPSFLQAWQQLERTCRTRLGVGCLHVGGLFALIVRTMNRTSIPPATTVHDPSGLSQREQSALPRPVCSRPNKDRASARRPAWSNGSANLDVFAGRRNRPGAMAQPRHSASARADTRRVRSPGCRAIVRPEPASSFCHRTPLCVKSARLPPLDPCGSKQCPESSRPG